MTLLWEKKVFIIDTGEKLSNIELEEITNKLDEVVIDVIADSKYKKRLHIQDD